MKNLKKFIGSSIFVGLLLLPPALLWLWARPPELIRVGAAYTAKTVCSNVFLAHRDPAQVLATDVQAPGHPLLKLMLIQVDWHLKRVRAGLFGFIGGGLAIDRPGVGCAVVPDGRPATGGAAFDPSPHAMVEAPDEAAGATNLKLRAVLDDDALAGPGMRAIVVLHEGRLVAERYAGGFRRDTPQLGWSMTKSVTAGLIGVLIEDGRLALDRSAGWRGDDARGRITIADLMSMTSGLGFNEEYGAVSDVTRMLYLEPDMAAFARAQPLAHPVGKVWSYSSGSAVILAQIVQDSAGADAATFARTHLFEPLGMTSAVLETDEKGTLVGSSYLYATPRDWARYGQLLVQDGVWQGRDILPRGYVAMMASPVAQSGGTYGRGMVWRWVSGTGFEIPDDTFWMSGHDGQHVAIIRSRQLVIVRMGLTPEHEHYRPEPLVRAVLEAVR